MLGIMHPIKKKAASYKVKHCNGPGGEPCGTLHLSLEESVRVRCKVRGFEELLGSCEQNLICETGSGAPARNEWTKSGFFRHLGGMKLWSAVLLDFTACRWTHRIVQNVRRHPQLSLHLQLV